MSAYALAQLNIAMLRAPIDTPLLADFVANLDRINALAEAADGFVWRMKSEADNASATQVFGTDMLVNLSVWTDRERLRAFVYQSAHVDILRRGHEWFQPLGMPGMVLWWVAADHRPSAQEASDRLELLRREGPGPNAFTFGRPFPPPA